MDREEARLQWADWARHHVGPESERPSAAGEAALAAMDAGGGTAEAAAAAVKAAEQWGSAAIGPTVMGGADIAFRDAARLPPDASSGGSSQAFPGGAPPG